MPTFQIPQALMVPDKLEEMHIWIELAMTMKRECHQSIGQGNTVHVAVEGDEVEVGQPFIKIGAVEKSYSILREYISKFGLVLYCD